MNADVSAKSSSSRSVTPELTFERELALVCNDLRQRALRLTRDGVAAEDLVQDTIERALKFRHQYQPGTSLACWLRTIAFSLFVSKVRRSRRERCALERLGCDPTGWLQNPQGDVTAKLPLTQPLKRALESLPATYRDVVMLVDIGEYSYRDAAAELRVPVGTVMSRLHRGRKQLAVDLGESLAA